MSSPRDDKFDESQPIEEFHVRHRFFTHSIHSLCVWIPGLYKFAKSADKLAWRLRIRRIRESGRKRIALASYPRSGNTWMRILIESATGEHTDSVHGMGRVPIMKETRRQRQLESGSMTQGREPIVIKTHGYDTYRYTHAVYLVRNPFDAIHSHWHFTQEIFDNQQESRRLSRLTRRVAGLKVYDDPNNEQRTWDDFVKERADDWVRHARSWLAADVEKFLVRYEDLHADPEKVLTNVVRWLGRDVTSETIHQAVESSRIEKLRQVDVRKGDKFFREGKVATGIEAFTEEQRRYVIATVADVLGPLGYGELLKYGQLTACANDAQVSASVIHAHPSGGR